MSAPKRIDEVIDFAHHEVAPEQALVASERMVSGAPCRTTTWNHYSDPTGQFFAGIWAAEVGAMTVNYTEEELCYILEGRVRLSDSSGAAREFGPGSAFVIPAGFSGVWETLEPVKKIYTIWQPKA
ncbi:MAG: cupin domain-containing protein [Pseudomonadota bacterium]